MIFNSPCAPPGRMRPSVAQYAAEIGEGLLRVSEGRLWSRLEWSPLIPDEREPYLGAYRNNALIYSPRIDLAAGPFATDGSLSLEFDRMLGEQLGLLERLLEAHHENARQFPDIYSPPSVQSLCETNLNPRCFLAIEIESGNVNMKHLLGSAFQAAAWGKVGIVVCCNSPRLRSVMGISEMLSLLGAYGKNTFSTGNLLILNSNQVDDVLNIPPPQKRSFSVKK